MNDDRTLLPPIQLTPKTVELRPKATTSIELIVDNTGKPCLHHKTVIDRWQRRVTCKTCDATLDPFDVLLGLAQESARYSEDLARTKAEIRGASSRLELLKRLEQNARARVKKFGGNVTTYHLDALLHYVATLHPTREPTARSVEYQLESMTPVARLQAAAAALEKGHGLAAVALASAVVDELRAALELHGEAETAAGTPARPREVTVRR